MVVLLILVLLVVAFVAFKIWQARNAALIVSSWGVVVAGEGERGNEFLLQVGAALEESDFARSIGRTMPTAS